jgi:hypothetical protein
MISLRGADCIKVYDRLPRESYFAIITGEGESLPVGGHVPLRLLLKKPRMQVSEVLST